MPRPKYDQYDGYMLRRRKPKLPRRSSATTTKKPSNNNRLTFSTFPLRDSFVNDTTTPSSILISNRTKTLPEEEESQIIDILKDRKIYEEVQRSRTNDINCVWVSIV